MANNKTVEINLKVDTGNSAQAIDKVDKSVDNLNADLNKTNTAAEKQQTGFGKLQSMSAGVVAGYAAIAAAMAQVIQLAKESIQEFLTADKVQQQVNQAFGDYADEISNAANAFEKATSLEAEKFMELSIAAQAYGATNKNVNDIVNKSIGLAKQFALQGVSEEMALKALIKAQNGQYKALETIYPALKNVSDEQEKMRIINEFSAKGWEKLNAYTDTYSGKLALMENEIGNVKETVGEGILSGLMGDGPEEIQIFTDSVADFSAALQETEFISKYIEQAIAPMQTLFSIFGDILSLFGDGDEEINGFAVALDGWLILIKMVNLPLNMLFGSLSAIFKLLTGDWKGALNAITKPFKDLLEPIISLGKQLGIISDGFELFEEEASGSIDEVTKSIERFGGETATQYKKVGTSQEELLAASRVFADEFIGLTEDEKLAVQDLTLTYRKGVQDRINAYIEEVGIWDATNSVRLQWLSDTLHDMEVAYNKDLEKYKKLNEDRLNVDNTVTKETKIELTKREKAIKAFGDFLLGEQERLASQARTDILDKFFGTPKSYKQKVDEMKLAIKNFKDSVQEDIQAEEVETPDSWLAVTLGVDDQTAEMLMAKGEEAIWDMTDKLNEIALLKQQELFDAKQAALDDQLERELNATEGNEEETMRIKTKFARHQEALDKEIAESRKRNAIKGAIIDGAKSIAGIWAEYGAVPVVAAILTAISAGAVAAQIGVISNQKFAKGGILNGPSHQNGGIQTMFGELEGNEYVINTKATKRYAPVLDKINAYGNSSQSGDIIDYNLLSTMLADKINDKKVYVVSSEMSKQQAIDTRIVNRATI